MLLNLSDLPRDLLAVLGIPEPLHQARSWLNKNLSTQQWEPKIRIANRPTVRPSFDLNLLLCLLAAHK
jgi:hypothetical protein